VAWVPAHAAHLCSRSNDLSKRVSSNIEPTPTDTVPQEAAHAHEVGASKSPTLETERAIVQHPQALKSGVAVRWEGLAMSLGFAINVEPVEPLAQALKSVVEFEVRDQAHNLLLAFPDTLALRITSRCITVLVGGLLGELAGLRLDIPFPEEVEVRRQHALGADGVRLTVANVQHMPEGGRRDVGGVAGVGNEGVGDGPSLATLRYLMSLRLIGWRRELQRCKFAAGAGDRYEHCISEAALGLRDWCAQAGKPREGGGEGNGGGGGGGCEGQGHRVFVWGQPGRPMMASRRAVLVCCAHDASKASALGRMLLLRGGAVTLVLVDKQRVGGGGGGGGGEGEEGGGDRGEAYTAGGVAGATAIELTSEDERLRFRQVSESEIINPRPNLRNLNFRP
jgi:hypothetical protein